MSVIEEARKFAASEAGLTEQEARFFTDAYLSRLSELGYVVVPREPTPAMVAACGKTAQKINPALKAGDYKSIAFDGLSIYRAMIAASQHDIDPQQGGKPEGD